jgi:hypothetical protein
VAFQGKSHLPCRRQFRDGHPVRVSLHGAFDLSPDLGTAAPIFRRVKGTETAKRSCEILPIWIDFDLLPVRQDNDRKLRSEAKRINTSWTISEAEFQTIEKAGQKLLYRDGCFKQFLAEISVNHTINEEEGPECNKDD